MRFHGRMSPGRVDDLGKPVQVVIHAPTKLAGATIKIWEMDSFSTGKTGETKEGSADDLLATFRGDIASVPHATGTRPPDWRTFKVSGAKIEAAKADIARFKLQFAGSDTSYEIPLLSEAGEVEGGAYEVGFSIEVGGAEKFRTKSPCLVTPKITPLRLVARVISHIDKRGIVKKTMFEQPLAYRCVAIGTRTTTDATAKLEILARGCTDSGGYLLDRDLDEPGDGPPRPLIVRADRELFLIDAALPFEKTGVTEIPIAACDQIVVRGHDVSLVRSGIADPMSLSAAERSLDEHRRFREAKVDAPDVATGIRRLAVRARSKQGGER